MARKIIRTDDALAGRLKNIAVAESKEDQKKAGELLAGNFEQVINTNFGFSVPDEASALTVNPDNMINEGVLPGDIFSDIFETNMLGWDQYPSYPADLVAPGTEGEFAAYTVPQNGAIPRRLVEGDELTISTYRIGNSIDWNIRYARAGRIDVVTRALQAFQNGFVQKMNDDAWHTIIAAGLDRGLMAYDTSATDGVFSKKLLQIMKISMIRNGGGNLASNNGFNLTDIYISPECMEDIVNFSNTDLSELSRRDMEISAEGTVKRLFGVNLHVLTELGDGQAYTNYFKNTLSGSLNGSDTELIVGLDRSRQINPFIMPVRGSGIEIYYDEALARSGVVGFWGAVETGFAVLDSRSVLLASA